MQDMLICVRLMSPGCDKLESRCRHLCLSTCLIDSKLQQQDTPSLLDALTIVSNNVWSVFDPPEAREHFYYMRTHIPLDQYANFTKFLFETMPRSEECNSVAGVKKSQDETDGFDTDGFE